jgi:hypothetical protein
MIDEVRSIVEGAKSIVRPRPRDVSDANSRSATLAALEAEIANFDSNQRKVAISLLLAQQNEEGRKLREFAEVIWKTAGLDNLKPLESVDSSTAILAAPRN